MDWFDDWALTLAVFIPLVGMVIVLLIPKAEENLIKVVALLTTLLTGAVGIGILANFNLDDGTCSSRPTSRGSTSSTAGTTSASTASRCRC